jgi:hypothetical protein
MDQDDGKTEIMNQYLDQRLRPFVNRFQDSRFQRCWPCTTRRLCTQETRRSVDSKYPWWVCILALPLLTVTQKEARPASIINT